MAFLVSASAAWGAGRDARERTARTACLAGDFAKGAAILSQLFVETRDATYIYNQGRCFEQNARYPEAIARFQEYLLVGRKLGRKDKAEAERHIRRCQEMLAGQSAQPEVVPEAAPPKPAPGSTPASLVVSPPPAASSAGPPMVERALPDPASAADSPGAGLRTAGVVTASVGGAVLVAGIILNLKVNSMAGDFETLNGYTDDKESNRKTYETFGWIGYGVGAACIATGAVLYVLGRRAGREGSSSLALVPALASGEAGAILKGAF